MSKPIDVTCYACPTCGQTCPPTRTMTEIVPAVPVQRPAPKPPRVRKPKHLLMTGAAFEIRGETLVGPNGVVIHDAARFARRVAGWMTTAAEWIEQQKGAKRGK